MDEMEQANLEERRVSIHELTAARLAKRVGSNVDNDGPPPAKKTASFSILSKEPNAEHTKTVHVKNMAAMLDARNGNF